MTRMKRAQFLCDAIAGVRTHGSCVHGSSKGQKGVRDVEHRSPRAVCSQCRPRCCGRQSLRIYRLCADVRWELAAARTSTYGGAGELDMPNVVETGIGP
jgi:hypothetical protein